MNDELLQSFFTWTGIIFWAVIACIIVGIVISFICYFLSDYVWPSLRNIKYGLFGSKKLVKTYSEAWEIVRKNPKLIKNLHSRKKFKRFAYRRFLKEVRKELKNGQV